MGMLILCRKEQESIMIGDNIVITVLRLERGRVKIGINAPKDVKIERDDYAGKDSDQELPGPRENHR